MTDEIGAPAKAVSAWKQVATALILVPALGIGLWKVQASSSSDGTPAPATCPEPDQEPGNAHGQVSGTQLCTALNRPDLPDLLGTPAEAAKAASSHGGSLELASGTRFATPSARVELDTYTATLSASYDRLPVTETAALLGDGARPRTVLGRPAVLYADHTISIRFRLDGGDSDNGPGVPERTLVVARDSEDSGGSFELALWRADGEVPDDGVLLHLAETVLPTIPGWEGGTATA
ncbi:DUF6215 domain-containing protein [Streptomyces sp. NPDC020917]|uniref:DUF6215 domain-containing protein n=1 Tax=Streptomyces sp. NPDC020917 TaxID=3365102 RepID=UPI00378C47D5